MFLVALLIVTKAVGVVANTFQQVSSTCIYWDSLQTYKDSSKIRLHCILDEQNQLGIVNVTWKLIEPGKCPYYDRISGQIHAKPCDNSKGKCPTVTLSSYQAVKYSACYAAEIRDLGTPLNETEVFHSPTSPECGSCHLTDRIHFAVVEVIICILLLAILMLLCCRRYGKIRKGKCGIWRCEHMNGKTLCCIKEEYSDRDMKTQSFLKDIKVMEFKPTNAKYSNDHTPHKEQRYRDVGSLYMDAGHYQIRLLES